jgi:hypothetical protein
MNRNSDGHRMCQEDFGVLHMAHGTVVHANASAQKPECER